MPSKPTLITTSTADSILYDASLFENRTDVINITNATHILTTVPTTAQTASSTTISQAINMPTNYPSSSATTIDDSTKFLSTSPTMIITSVLSVLP